MAVKNVTGGDTHVKTGQSAVRAGPDVAGGGVAGSGSAG